MRRTRLLPLALLAAVALSACSGGKSVAVGGASGGGASASAGGTLVAAISGEPDQLDPQKTSAYASFQVLENVFDTLVQPGKDLQFEPALAASWKTSADNRTWTFTMRDGVTWQNGRPFTSADVVYSYNRIIKEKLANAYRFQAVRAVTAPDPKTVVIALTRPSPNLLASIGSFKGTAIVAKENVEDGSIGKKPIGTGPFSFASYAPGDTLKIVRNDSYWGTKPKLDGVQFRFLAEPTVALTNLQGGQVQWTDNLPPQQVASLQKSDDITVQRTPSTDYWYLAPNEKRKPFDDPRVRQAIALGIDRKAVTEAAKFGLATENQTAIPKGSTFFTDYGPYTRDVARAKGLLQQAGVTGRLPMDLMVTNEYPETVTAAQVMSSELKEVGIDVKIRTLDFAAWLDQEGKGSFDTFMLGWLGNIDPDDYYYAQHHTGGSFNFQGFSDKQVDALLDQGRRTVDQAQRKQAYDTAARRIVDQASYVYLYNPDVVQGWSPKLKGYEVRADRAIRFKDAALAK